MNTATFNLSSMIVVVVALSCLTPYPVSIVINFLVITTALIAWPSAKISRNGVIFFCVLLVLSAISAANAMLFNVENLSGYTRIDGVKISGLTKILASPIIAANIVFLYFASRSMKTESAERGAKFALIFFTAFIVFKIASVNLNERLTIPISTNPNVAALLILIYIYTAYLLRSRHVIGEANFLITATILSSAAILTGSKSVSVFTVLFLASARPYYILAIIIPIGAYALTKVDFNQFYAIERIIGTFDFSQITYRIFNQWSPAISYLLENPWGAGLNFIYSTDSGYIKLVAETGVFSFFILISWSRLVIHLKSIHFSIPISIFSITFFNENPIYNQSAVLMMILLTALSTNLGCQTRTHHSKE